MSEKRVLLLDQIRARLEFLQEAGVGYVEPSALAALRAALAPSQMTSGRETAIPVSGQVQSDVTSVSESKVIAYGSGSQASKSPLGAEVKTLSIFESRWDTGNTESLEAIRQDIGDCQRCKLCSARTNIVFGSGNPNARLVFVGEGPGADEDAQGLPFVGRAGQLLTKIIEAINFKRDEVYICNVVKCRPPGNRFPEKDEIGACSPFLLRQLEAIKPEVICCLGAAAAQTLLNTKSAIGSMRGRFRDFRGARLMVTYHPAYLLRNPDAKREVWEDMKKVRDYLNAH